MPLADLTQPASLALKIVAGDSFSREIVLKENGTPINLTGLEAKAQIREHPGGKLYAEFSCNVTPADGKITFTLDRDQTRAIPGKGEWDLEVYHPTDPTIHHTIVQGLVTLLPDVSR